VNDEVGLGLLDRLSQHDLAGLHHVSGLVHRYRHVDANLRSYLQAHGWSKWTAARISRATYRMRQLQHRTFILKWAICTEVSSTLVAPKNFPGAWSRV
jgi:hypothetical protein